jgi:hypothetical protein
MHRHSIELERICNSRLGLALGLGLEAESSKLREERHTNIIERPFASPARPPARPHST